jgi:hypothetical protein
MTNKPIENNDCRNMESWEIVKNDDISMFASEEDLFIYQHFFEKGKEYALKSQSPVVENQEEIWSEISRVLKIRNTNDECADDLKWLLRKFTITRK